jgi:hypothetical protein
LGNETKAAVDVFKRPRPTATGIAHTPIFHIPCRHADSSQSGTEMASVSEVVPGAPEAAMKEDYERVKALLIVRSPKIAKLLWIRPVMQTFIGFWGRQSQNTFATHR